MKRVYAIFMSCLLMASAWSQIITVSGNKFKVDGKDIYINGVNAPWQYQSDCGISFMRYNFDWNYWNNELQKYADNKVNVVRVWLHGNGNYSPSLNGSGSVNSYASTDQFWKDMDALVAIAASKKIYLMPTFWSFDMASTNGWYFSQYRQILTDDNKAGSYINNFLIPFVQRYANNNWIMGYDLCNEPEHIWRDANCGNLSAWWVTRFFARCAAAVHNNSSKPVTIGAMWAIYNSNTLGNGDGDAEAGFNRYSDVNMKNYFNDTKSYLDFYTPHWYQWQGSNGPFNRTVSQWIGSDDKPVVTAETYGGDLSFISMANFYNYSYNNGFDGTMGWKNACQNDGYGTWDGVKSGTWAFFNAHSSLVYPYLSSGGGTTSNVAYNKPVNSSSVESSTYAASLAVDANGTTRWASAASDQQWIYIDLQSTYNITSIKLAWEAAYAKQFQLQVSNDNVTWTTVYNNYAGTGGTTTVNVATSGRYVKMYAWQRATVYGYSLWEFEVYGTIGTSSAKIRTNVVDAKMEGLQLYPNPAKDKVTISTPDNASEIVISDMAGRIIKRISLNGTTTNSIDVSSWERGVYFFRSGLSLKKLVVQ